MNLLGTLGSLAIVGWTGSIAARRTPFDPTRQEIYCWFDSLGFTGGLKGQFGEIKFWTMADARVDQPSTFGFLERRAGKSFTVRDVLFGETEYSASMPGESHAEFRPLDFKRWLEEQKNLGADMQYPFKAVSGLMTLSREADLRRWPDLSDWFYKRSHAPFETPFAFREPSDYLGAVKAEIQDRMIMDTWDSFLDPDAAWDQLLMQMTVIATRFPASRQTDEAAQAVKVLDQMVRAEKVRHDRSDTELAKLPPAAQAEELVWQLRNQNGLEYGQSADFAFLTYHHLQDSPGNRLAKLGRAAVPALIGALNDQRFTRTGQPWKSSWRPGVLQVRWLALEILDEISSSQFYPPPPERPEGPWPQVIAAARSWWAAVQTGTEEKQLGAAIAKGEQPDQALRFATLYPDSALQAIESGYEHAKSESDRVRLIDAVGRLSGRAAEDFSRSCMLHGPTFYCRLAGAENVRRKDPDAAVDAMLKEWEQMTPQERGRPLLAFLLTSGRADVVRKMAASLSSVVPYVRGLIVLRIGLGPDEDAGNVPGARKSKAYLEAVEDLLASELTDKSIWDGRTVIGEYVIENRRVCDLACCTLATYWPTKYHYTDSSSSPVRDAGCTACLETWRKSRVH